MARISLSIRAKLLISILDITCLPVDVALFGLNAFHGTCGPLIEVYGSTLERFLGDGVMVLIGAFVSIEDAAERAVALTREMQDAVRKALNPLSSKGTNLALV